MRKRIVASMTAAMLALVVAVPAQASHGEAYLSTTCGGSGANVRAYVQNTSSVDRVIQRHHVRFIADGPGAETDVTRPTLNLPVSAGARRQIATVNKEQGPGFYDALASWIYADVPSWVNVQLAITCLA